MTLTVLAAGLLVLLGVAGGGSDAGGPVHQVTVRSGDTLWGIASANAPGADVRAVIDQIQQLNGLDDGALQAGIVLQVPTG